MADDKKDDVATDDTPAEEEGKVEDTTEVVAEEAEPAPSEAEGKDEAPVDDKAPESLQEPEGSSEPQTASSDSGDEGYQFDDDLSSSEPAAPAASGGQGGSYAQELFSKTIHAKFRTFFVDLKESVNGKFLKISEKSRGRKSTIMMDAEDVPAIIEALQEVQKQL